MKNTRVILLLVALLGYFIGTSLETVGPQERRIENVYWVAPTADRANFAVYQQQSVGMRFKVTPFHSATGKTLGPALKTSTLNSCLSGDGKTFAALDQDGLRVWNVADGEPRSRIKFPVGKLFLSRDGARLISLYQTGQRKQTLLCRVHDTNTGEKLFESRLRSQDFRGAQLSADGKQIAITDRGTTYLSDVDTGHTRLVINGDMVSSTSPAFQGRWFSRDERSGMVRLYDFKTRSLVGPALKHPQTAVYMGCDKSGQRLLTLCGDGKVRVWDRKSGEVLFKTAGWGAALSSDGTRLTVTRYPTRNDSETIVFNIENGRKQKTVRLSPPALQISADHTQKGGQIWLFDREALMAVPYKT